MKQFKLTIFACILLFSSKAFSQNIDSFFVDIDSMSARQLANYKKLIDSTIIRNEDRFTGTASVVCNLNSLKKAEDKMYAGISVYALTPKLFIKNDSDYYFALNVLTSSTELMAVSTVYFICDTLKKLQYSVSFLETNSDYSPYTNKWIERSLINGARTVFDYALIGKYVKVEYRISGERYYESHYSKEELLAFKILYDYTRLYK